MLSTLFNLVINVVSRVITPEFVVEYVQWLLPTWFCQLGVRLYLRHVAGPNLRGGDVVCRQIWTDTVERDKEPVTTQVEEANETLSVARRAIRTWMW